MSKLPIFELVSLVVLSCCHRGRGRVLDGEGVVGITHAFLGAGARSVLVTLWAIDDEATMVFYEKFLPTSEGRKNRQCCCSGIDSIPS